jgi:hypothetical protein
VGQSGICGAVRQITAPEIFDKLKVSLIASVHHPRLLSTASFPSVPVGFSAVPQRRFVKGKRN